MSTERPAADQRASAPADFDCFIRDGDDAIYINLHRLADDIAFCDGSSPANLWLWAGVEGAADQGDMLPKLAETVERMKEDHVKNGGKPRQGWRQDI